MLSRTDAAGHTTKLTYDGKGNVLSVTDALGQTTTMTYNERNKLLSQTNPAGEKTSYDYDGKGNLIAVFQPNGNTINYDYDLSDRVIQIWDNMGVIAKYTYDGNGNRITITDGMERTVNYAYDGLNRRTIETLPSGAVTRYAYDANSNLLTVTDALNNVTSYTYSSLNQHLSHIDALNAKTTFEYDGNGNLVKATDARNNATTWTYDALNRNTHISFANGTSLQYSYDVLGNVIESKDRAGNATKYTYDAIGNLLNKTYADNTRDEFAYDAVDQMLKAVNKNATAQFVYDKAGRLLSETLNGKTMSYAYNIAEGLRTYTYPSGMKVEEHLNGRDLISNIMQNGSEAVAMTYNVAGQKTTQTYANGITTNYEYNENGWLSRIADDAQILDLAMTYDALGNITQRKDNIDETQTENYGYDAISQLVSFKRGTAVDKTYQFDLLGNRIKTVENGITTNYTANNVNAYTSITGGLTFTPKYDGNGNLLNDDKHTYVYDLNNRMVSADNEAVTFRYDALGRRIAKNDITYCYIGDQMVEEYNGNALAASYLYGNNIDEALQMTRGEKAYYYQTNHLGSTMALTNSAGKLIERVAYDVYGVPTFVDSVGAELATSSVGNNILFTGREYDAELGIYYFRARNYHSYVGRFNQHDPLWYIGTMNDYSYTLQNPIVLTDHSGKKPTYQEARELAKAAYKGNSSEVNGWNRILTLNDNSSGFRGILYEKSGEYVFATSGTDDLKDWRNNLRQGLGLQSDQYDQSIYWAKKISEQLQDCELTFVGHSLGGGLASANSRATGRPAITFNPAALHKKYNQGKKSDIDNYVSDGDILDYANRRILKYFNQNTQGNRHYVNVEKSQLPNLNGIPKSGLYQAWRGVQIHRDF